MKKECLNCNQTFASYERRAKFCSKRCSAIFNNKNKTLKTPAGQGGLCELFSRYKKSAKTRGLKWELTKEDFRVLTQGDCYYCGIAPKQKVYGKGRTTEVAVAHSEYVYNGIDRLFNDGSYVILNCVPCCGVCNMRKNDSNKDEFIEWLDKVYNHVHQKEIPQDLASTVVKR